MCLAIPMKVTAIDGFIARCSAMGEEREASLFLMQQEEVVVGDYVIIHLGNVTQVIAEEDALKSWELFKEILLHSPNS
jgi:hydrogenase expression/formation protein HypC